MEGPKEITILVFKQKYKSCQFCKHYTVNKILVTDFSGEAVNNFLVSEYNCGHLDRKGLNKLLLWSDKTRLIGTIIETPNWCPYLDSNNRRKVLVEKLLNKKWI